MKCLVFVKFLPGGSIAPDQFFSHINAEWGWYDEENESEPSVDFYNSCIKSAVCLTDYDTIHQLAIDLSIMPGAGIAGIEVLPVPEETENTELLRRLTVGTIYT